MTKDLFHLGTWDSGLGTWNLEFGTRDLGLVNHSATVDGMLHCVTNDIIYNMLLFIQLHFLCQAFSPDTILLTVSSLKARLKYAGLSDLKAQDEISMSFPSFCPIKKLGEASV